MYGQHTVAEDLGEPRSGRIETDGPAAGEVSIVTFD
jgi:hypothetical protein